MLRLWHHRKNMIVEVVVHSYIVFPLFSRDDKFIAFVFSRSHRNYIVISEKEDKKMYELIFVKNLNLLNICFQSIPVSYSSFQKSSLLSAIQEFIKPRHYLVYIVYCSIQWKKFQKWINQIWLWTVIGHWTFHNIYYMQQQCIIAYYGI